MTRLYLGVLGLALLTTIQPGLAGKDDTKQLPSAVALQQAIQKVIEDAEPSVACILVSRSDFYQKYGFDYSLYEPGKLGGYDARVIDDLLQKKGLSREKRDEIIRQLDLADPDYVPEGYGSGVVLDEKGLILTHYHVVQGATKIFVRLPGNRWSYADVHAADPRSDLAVLRLHDATLKVKSLPAGQGDLVKRGQFVVSLANCFAVGVADGQPSASFGIVSNLRRSAPKGPHLKEWQKSLHHCGTLLQTDVQLRHGCSGGALLSLDGKLIGLTTAQSALYGIDVPGGFALPLDKTIRQVIDILRKGEEVEYGFLGVSFQTVKKPGPGVVLSQVIDGSPADQVGLRPGDLILAVNDQPIAGGDDMFLALSRLFAGTKATLGVKKSGKKFEETVHVTMTKSHVFGKTIAANTRRPYFRGFRIDYSSLAVQCKYPGFQYEDILKGVLVTDVQPGSPAATALLKPGEIITHVNGQPVETPDQFYVQVHAARGPVELTLVALHGLPAPKVTIN